MVDDAVATFLIALIEMAETGERKGDGRPLKRSHGATVFKLSDLGTAFKFMSATAE